MYNGCIMIAICRLSLSIYFSFFLLPFLFVWFSFLSDSLFLFLAVYKIPSFPNLWFFFLLVWGQINQNEPLTTYHLGKSQREILMWFWQIGRLRWVFFFIKVWTQASHSCDFLQHPFHKLIGGKTEQNKHQLIKKLLRCLLLVLYKLCAIINIYFAPIIWWIRVPSYVNEVKLSHLNLLLDPITMSTCGCNMNL